MIVEVISSAVLLVVLTAFVKHLQYRKQFNKVPGWNGLPLIGSALSLKSDNAEYFSQIMELCAQNYKTGIMKFWMGHRASVVVFRADTVEELLKGTTHMTKGFFYDFLHPWLGDGLLMSDGQKWFDRRRMITPAFHFSILDQFIHVFNDQAGVLVKILQSKADGSEFDIQPYIFRCMLDIICETAMGVNIQAQERSEAELVRTFYKQGDLVLHRMKYPWLWSDFLYWFSATGREEKKCLKILKGFTRKVIADRKRELQTRETTGTGDSPKQAEHQTLKKVEDDSEQSIYLSKKRRLAFLDMLLEASANDPSLMDNGIQEEVDTFMFEGHDTTASGAIWILYMLAWHPNLQVKVQQEIDEVLGDTDRPVTTEDIRKLNYTECVIKETLRLFPPVIWFTRTISAPCTIGGFTIPKGVAVSVNNYILHRDPEHFPDPEKFDPDRWMSDSAATRHPYCYTPFSAGPRNCIGQRFAMLEEKVVLCHLMRHFTVMSRTKRENLVPMATLILKPNEPVPIQLIKRK